jgi:hypothetical protein
MLKVLKVYQQCGLLITSPSPVILNAVTVG